jgi:hypothetical protein
MAIPILGLSGLEHRSHEVAKAYRAQFFNRQSILRGARTQCLLNALTKLTSWRKMR